MELRSLLKGRIGRRDFIVYLLLSVLPLLACYLVENAVIYYIYPSVNTASNVAAVIDLVLILFDIGEAVGWLLIVAVALVLSVRRIHDIVSTAVGFQASVAE